MMNLNHLYDLQHPCRLQALWTLRALWEVEPSSFLTIISACIESSSRG